MVTPTEIAQLLGECNTWKEVLRSQREDLQQLKAQLTGSAAKENSKDILLEIEHLDNQFHIQLINIHDLKHNIKNHERKLETENASGSVSNELLAVHENLLDEYTDLNNTIDDLKSEYEHFQMQTI
jgi:predicted  nucleic acid-binding Zn-ribbon protein